MVKKPHYPPFGVHDQTHQRFLEFNGLGGRDFTLSASTKKRHSPGYAVLPRGSSGPKRFPWPGTGWAK